MRLITRDFTSPNTAKRFKASRFEVFEGFGSPEGVVTGKMGDYFINRNGGAGTTLYLKETGHATNTGWRAVGAASGWSSEQVFTATEGQTDFTITNFTFTANSKMTVYVNGSDQDEGGGLDWTRNVALQKITLSPGVKSQARVKIKLWS